MSLDFRLMFVYHGSMMLMMLVGQGLRSIRPEILFTLALVAVLASISLRHRSSTHWHWPGIGTKNILAAVGTAALIAFFLGGAMPLFPPSKPQALPWYLAGAGIGMFGILSALKLVYSSEAEFLLYCSTVDQYGQEMPRASELPQPKIVEVTWKKVVRVAHTTVFFLIWIIGVSSFYFYGVAFKAGSPTPTATRTEPLTDHGKTVYITPAEQKRIHLTGWVSGVGIGVVVLSGLFLHFVMGVKIFGDTKGLFAYRKRKFLS